jgi:CheY-like chemotaxis protein
MTLMLVDDDQDDIDLFSDVLNQIDRSIHLLTAHNGKDALNILSSDIFEKPDHIFLDINMPIMNGLDCLEALRTDLKINTPVTIYTTSKNPREYSRSLNLGADFLPKPHDYSTLSEILRKKINGLSIR